MRKLFMPYPRSLISAFIVRCLDSRISLLSISKISSLYLASVAAKADLSLPWSQTPKTNFLATRLNYCNILSGERTTKTLILLGGCSV